MDVKSLAHSLISASNREMPRLFWRISTTLWTTELLLCSYVLINLTQLINQPKRIADLCRNVPDLSLTSYLSGIHSLTYLSGLFNHVVLNVSLTFPFCSKQSRNKSIFGFVRNADTQPLMLNISPPALPLVFSSYSFKRRKPVTI